MLKEEDVAVCNVKIDLTRGKHNPLERYSVCFNLLILFTDDSGPSVCFNLLLLFTDVISSGACFGGSIHFFKVHQ